jgi:hypothetical protein
MKPFETIIIIVAGAVFTVIVTKLFEYYVEQNKTIRNE